MNRPLIRLLIAVSMPALAMSVQGCWGRDFWNAQEATLAIDSKVDSLLEENAVLQRRVYHLETLLEGQQEQIRRNGAVTSMDLEEIKDQIDALIVMIEENSRQVPVRTSVRHPSARIVETPDTTAAADSAARKAI